MKLSNTLHFCLLHLYNKKMIFAISFLLMLIGSIVFFNTFYVYLDSVSDILKERQYLGDRRDDLYVVKSEYDSFDFDYYEQYRDFLINAEETYNIGIYYYSTELFTSNFDADTVSEIQNICKDSVSVDMKDSLIIPTLAMNNILLSHMKFRDEDGNILKLSVQDDGTEEIAVGQELRDWFKIGDIINEDSAGKRYVVKAYLAPNSTWVSGGLLRNGVNVVSLSHSIVTPMVLSDYEAESCSVYVDNVYLCMDGVQDIKTMINNFETVAEETDIYIGVSAMKNAEKESISENNNVFQFSLLLVAVMLVTVSGVLIIFSVLSWMADSHDIGILYANGFSGGDIFRIIFFENFIKWLTAEIAVFLWLVVIYQDYLSQIEYKYAVFGVIALIMLAVVSLSSFASYALINRQNPFYLLKGEQA